MSEIEALRERVGKATGPDRELDDLILWVVDPEGDAHRASMRLVRPLTEEEIRGFSGVGYNRYTASIDAALGLCDRVASTWDWRLTAGGGGLTSYFELFVTGDDTEHHIADAEMPTAPLAILHALLAGLSQPQIVKEGE